MYNSFNYAMTLSRVQHPHQRFIPTVASFPRDGILLVNEADQILFANQSAEALLGIPVQRLFEKTFPFSASLGISVYPDHGEDGETLVKHADAAMYHAKQQKGRYRFFQNAH